MLEPHWIKARLKLAFIHNYYIHYRVPLFKMLSKIFEIKFFFDDIHEFVEGVDRELDFVLNVGSKIKGIRIPILLLFYLIKYKPDIIIAGDATNPSTMIAFVASKLLRKPFILWEERWFWSSRLKLALLWSIARFMALKSDALVVPGALSKRFYESIGIKEEKIIVAPNVSYSHVDEKLRAKAKELRKRLNLGDKIVVLYLGRVVPFKGVHLVLKAFSKLREEGLNKMHLLIVGGKHDPVYRELLDKYIKIKNLSDAVTITGFVEEKEKGVFFELADIVVYPSYYEVWGMVVNEAASMGKPVISTTTCAAAYDVLKEYPWLTISPGKVDELVESLRLLIMNPSLRKDIGAKLRSLINEKFSYEEMLRGFIRAIKYVLYKHSSISKEGAFTHRTEVSAL